MMGLILRSLCLWLSRVRSMMSPKAGRFDCSFYSFLELGNWFLIQSFDLYVVLGVIDVWLCCIWIVFRVWIRISCWEWFCVCTIALFDCSFGACNAFEWWKFVRLLLKLLWVGLIFDIYSSLPLFAVPSILVVVVGVFVLSIEELCLCFLLWLVKIFVGFWGVEFCGFVLDQSCCWLILCL